MRAHRESTMDTLGIQPLGDVEGLESYDDYYVSIAGEVWSTKHSKLRKLAPAKNRDKGGYLFVILTDKTGQKRKWYVHQLIARAFLGAPKEGEEVNHKNRNGLDNRLDNLEWCERAENVQHWVETRGAEIDEVVREKAKKLHAELCKKEQDMPDLHCFVNALLEGEIDRLLEQNRRAQL